MGGAAMTLFEKIWNRHVVTSSPDGESLLYVDRNLLHEGSFLAFDLLAQAGSRVREPRGSLAFVDHFAPTRRIEENRAAAIYDSDARHVIVELEKNAKAHGLEFLGLDDPLQGIMHVVGPELGLVLPGLVITGNDSHTCTNGAFGAFAFGIGQSEVKQVLETQTVWRTRPKTLRVRIDGRLPARVSSKDVALALIGRLGAGAGTGYVFEYAGSCVAAMSMEARMSLCNMSIEAGARSAMVSPDATTFEYLAKCPRAPKGAAWDAALTDWRALATDTAATFDKEVELDVSALAPVVTWGTSLDQAGSIEGRVPQPSDIGDEDRRAVLERSLAYMGLSAGAALSGIAIDRAFIGSCTNGRIEDLRVAADVLRNRRVRVPTLIAPGSMSVKRQAESEGLHEIFASAGAQWGDASCSMCVGSNGDLVAAGQRCASSNPRNFEGRQGIGARTHVMSPAMVAAAAVAGAITDVRGY
ncbi:MAG TPA: 3-isopropylmalate dehydratase large subunit [Burkholderiales bacterium]|nr:3-isopropylmalate dehydratase large subunit [Burkholderiales bacterium]